MKKLTYLQSAIILTGANMLTNVVAFIYRIFLSRSISVEGLGLYQLILPLYNLFITLVSGGITTAITKIVSVEYSKKNNSNIRKIVRVYGATAIIWSSAICVFTIVNARSIAQYILKDNRTMPSIIVFSPAIIFIAISAVIKGYFYGVEVVSPPAFIDVFEKITRLAVITVVTSILLPYGIVYVCAGAMFAMAAGEFISLVLLFIIYNRKKIKKTASPITIGSFSLVKDITLLALPLSISGALNTIIDMLSAVLIPRQLELAGFSHRESLTLYGQLTGMAMPLAFFPFIIVLSLGTTLIPAITSSYEKCNWDALNKKARDAITITTTIAFFSLLILMPDPTFICERIFKCREAGNILFFVCLGLFFEYQQFTLFSILNALGKQIMVLRASLLNIAITLICIFTLVPIRKFNIYGDVVGFVISAVMVFFLCARTLSKVPEINLHYTKLFFPPFCCFLLSFVVSKTLIFINFPLLSAIGISILLYLFLLIQSKVFSLLQIKKTIKFR